MRQLNVNEIHSISGGNYLSSLVGSIGGGITSGETAFLVTGLGVGFAVGGFIGRWSTVIGLVGIGGYAAWDWFSGSGDASSEG